MGTGAHRSWRGLCQGRGRSASPQVCDVCWYQAPSYTGGNGGSEKLRNTWIRAQLHLTPKYKLLPPRESSVFSPFCL